jgi:cytochrome c oxidase subunit II
MFWGPANTTGKVDSTFLFIVAISVCLLVMVTFTMIFFLIKYNRKRHPQQEEVKESTALEIIWTIVPTLLVLLMFYYGWVNFDYIRNPPPNAMPVNVIARQWSWLFKYENGKQSDVLRVPIGKPVKLILTSQDVIHSLFIPAFRIKEDCVPGMKTHLWFNANEAGTYNIFCTEYCGAGHSHMLSKVIVMPVNEFEAWYQAKKAVSPEKEGNDLLNSKGCLGCHSLDGTPKIGPTFKGLFGSKVTVSTHGKERVIVADEDYLKKSILEPQFDLVKGYPPVMPTVTLTQKELEAIIEYLEILK